jgi:hypothetical protein
VSLVIAQFQLPLLRRTASHFSDGDARLEIMLVTTEAAAWTNASIIFSDSSYRLRTQVSVHARLRELRLRVFHDEVSNIGSQLIAMTLLQQENRVNRSAKKAGTHQGEDGLAQGGVDHTPVEVWNQASFSEEMIPGVCPSRLFPRGSLFTSLSLPRPIVFLSRAHVWKRNFP